MWSIKKNVSFIVPLLFFLAYSTWWFSFTFFEIGTTIKSQYDLFSVTYGLMAIWGCIGGFYIAKNWGGGHTLFGKAILLFACGLGFQEVGQLIYTYYIYYLGVQVPYPSLGDIGYFGSILFYIYGVILLAKASGVRISFKSISHTLQGLLIPAAMLIFSYMFFLRGYEFDWSSPLTIFLDFGYPLGQAIYVSLALTTFLLSRKVLGGVMKYRVLIILLALFIQYLADFTFLYQAHNGTWTAGGINDYMYLISYFAMTLGLLQLNVNLINNKLDQKKK